MVAAEGEFFHRARGVVVYHLHQQAADGVVVRLADGACVGVFQVDGEGDGLRLFVGGGGVVVLVVAGGQQQEGAQKPYEVKLR